MAWADRRLANKTAAVAAGRGAYQAAQHILDGESLTKYTKLRLGYSSTAGGQAADAAAGGEATSMQCINATQNGSAVSHCFAKTEGSPVTARASRGVQGALVRSNPLGVFLPPSVRLCMLATLES